MQFILKIILWIKRNRWEFIFLLAILAVAAFFRFYRLPEYMTFLGDEGRDALMIKRILVGLDLPLIGPPTSVGNIYLGPLYYYMMAVPMAIFWLNPVAAALMVAVLGVAAVFLIYYLGRKWFGILPGILAAFLYAVSPVNIIYSRSSWNPNPAPFFALLAIFALDKARQSKNFYWLILTGIALAFAAQMHYLALTLLPIFGILWLYELILVFKKKYYRYFLSGSIGAAIAFLLLMSPLAVFDFRHNFLNYRALSAFFGERETTVNLNILNSIGRTVPIYTDKLIGKYLGAENQMVTIILAIVVIIPILFFFKRLFKDRVENINKHWPQFVLFVWLLGAMVGLSLYKQTIYDHYLGFVNPVPYLLLGASISYLKGKWQIAVFLGFMAVLSCLNLQKSPLLLPPSNQLQRTQEIAQFVIQRSGGKPFNFALIAKSNYDAAYQYYLDLYGHKPKIVPLEITDQLFVVCEDQICNPVGHPKYEIAGFGWTIIESEQNFSGVKVFKLIHNPEQK